MKSMLPITVCIICAGFIYWVLNVKMPVDKEIKEGESRKYKEEDPGTLTIDQLFDFTTKG